MCVIGYTHTHTCARVQQRNTGNLIWHQKAQQRNSASAVLMRTQSATLLSTLAAKTQQHTTAQITRVS
jgi:hypothetical protein